MQEKNKYLTKSKKIMLKYIKEMNDSFSSQKLYETILSNNEQIGLTTIYRFLDELEKNNIVKKFYDDNNTAKYQYLEKCDNNNHFYLKCNKCGVFIHIDCDCIIDLHNHILINHQFKTDDNNIIITGLCNKCLEGK